MLRRIEFDGAETQAIHYHEKSQLENRKENVDPTMALVLRHEILRYPVHGLGIDDLYCHIHTVSVEKVRPL